MNSKLTLLALAVSFLLPSAHAQLTFPFSNLHSVNPYSFNAARAGNYIGTKAFASYKSRFTSVDRAPSLLSFGLDNPIGASSGVGLRFFNDTRGIFETFHIDASGSYALQIT
ncbi:MAG: type IX secretion system membrane protein PorP/SprF, partial [Bacteroidota bacterium]